MRVTVCELPDEPERLDGAWEALAVYLDRMPSDILVLPELPFFKWVYVGDAAVPAVWDAAVAAHEAGIARLDGVNASCILGSQPVVRDGRRLNEAFVWTQGEGCRPARAKWYLPDAPDARETIWFDRGDPAFRPVSAGPVSVGFQLCSEMTYPEHAREMGLAGAQLIAQPRATSGHRRWPILSAMAAIGSGCFVASANRRSVARDWFAGGSWIYSPEGACLAQTSADIPFASAEIDLDEVQAAQSTYPRDLYRAYAASGRS